MSASRVQISIDRNPAPATDATDIESRTAAVKVKHTSRTIPFGPNFLKSLFSVSFEAMPNYQQRISAAKSQWSAQGFTGKRRALPAHRRSIREPVSASAVPGHESGLLAAGLPDNSATYSWTFHIAPSSFSSINSRVDAPETLSNHFAPNSWAIHRATDIQAQCQEADRCGRPFNSKFARYLLRPNDAAA